MAPDAPTVPHFVAPTLELPREGRAAARRAARAKRAAELDALRRLVPRALVVAVLAGGTTAFVAHDKEVRLSVDGRERSLHTFAADVGGLLESEGLDTGPHDLVSPSPGEAITDGDEIKLRRGRPVTLTLDGERHRIWTTARTVEGALRLLGVRAEGAHLSVPRHAAISRRGLDLEVRTERTVTFLADGRERTIRTNAATVRRAVAEAGIVLRGEDTTSVPPDSYPLDGQRVSVLRITGSREVREEVTPFRTVERSDPTLFEGTRVVVRRGVLGVRRVTYALRTVNGVEQKPRKLSAETVREPVDQIEHIGTKPLPGSVGGADGLNWKALAQCEAGGRPNAVDPSGTHGGLYQFDTRTWQRLGGTGRPQDAPAAEQTHRAKKLYVQRGASPWPVCGRKLHQ
ncbi:ubiquitin-like domain-containing protein [Streptomyces sp. MTZ3.1]|uniref:Ubiquitin-like domain-containing protein n=1 Tax=Streptomyces meridianus TaxID=2938945 RepID=A0ABT0X9B2_9ACTN|nr:ubiquitin-like domain-containing protein [Streptomyces meridianus]